VHNFQILIVSLAKICKQCLQTASASRPTDLIPDHRPPPTGGLLHPTDPWAIAPPLTVAQQSHRAEIESGLC